MELYPLFANSTLDTGRRAPTMRLRHTAESWAACFDDPTADRIVQYREEVWRAMGREGSFRVNRDLLSGHTRLRTRIRDIELLSGDSAPLRSLHSTDGLRHRAEPQFARVPAAFRVSIKTHMAEDNGTFVEHTRGVIASPHGSSHHIAVPRS